MIHLLESTEHRRNRLGGYCHAQALCSTGDGHAKTTTNKSKVTCPRCLERIKKFPNAHK